MTFRRRWWSAWLLGALAVGCGGPPGTRLPVVYDLAELRPLAELQRTTPVLPVGHAEGAVLGAGFDQLEQGPAGAFAWGMGESSELLVSVAVPRSLTLVLEGRAYPGVERRPQIVEVEVNGKAVGAVEIGRHPTVAELAVPAERLEQGDNRVTLRYAWSVRPEDERMGNTDARELAVAWRRIGFLVDEPATADRLSEDVRVLTLPAGSALSFYLELPPGSRLAWQEVDRWNRRSRLTVSWQPADGDERQLSPGRRGEIDLGVEATTLGRLTLAPQGEGGLDLVAPVVVAPAPDADRLAVAERQRPAAVSPAAPFNVILYVVDTLRADHLGCYGYERPTSPALDRLAARGALFRNTTSPSSWTRPAVASILTGLLPEEHGVQERRDRLPAAAETLAEALLAGGWATAGVITNGNVAGRFGLSQGFEHYRYLGENPRRPEVHKTAERVTDVAFEWLDQRPSDRPFFLYLHVSDPHAPYVPPERWRRRFAPSSRVADGSLDRVAALERGDLVPGADTAGELIDLYDGEIAAVDEAFGRLLARLEEEKLTGSTVVVFTADHGEEFGEHGGWQHGETLFEEQLAVPLVVRIPGRPEGLVVERRVSTVDIVPTLLAAVGLPVGARSGVSLLGDLEGFVPSSDRPAFSSLEVDQRRIRAVLMGQKKLVAYETAPRAGGTEQLFDLAADPGERRDLALESPVWKGYLAALLRTADESAGLAREEVEIDEELAARLKALGYLQ